MKRITILAALAALIGLTGCKTTNDFLCGFCAKPEAAATAPVAVKAEPVPSKPAATQPAAKAKAKSEPAAKPKAKSESTAKPKTKSVATAKQETKPVAKPAAQAAPKTTATPASGDLAKTGADLAKKRCSMCHNFDSTAKKVGPGLKGVYGRSPSISEVPFAKWDAAALDKWLTNPKAIKAKTPMAFTGFKNKSDRDAIIAFLKSL